MIYATALNDSPQYVLDHYSGKAELVDRDTNTWLVDFDEDEATIWAMIERFGWVSWADDFGIEWEAEMP